MKIAFISYEYPPDTAYGGIATYIYQAARILQRRGHHVEVFVGSPHRCGTETEDGIIVHQIVEKNRQEFSEHIGRIFAERHTTVKFDVLEGPEISAEARGAVELVPDIPLVVKLHTPSFLIGQLNYVQPSFLMKARRYIGALRRGSKPTPFPRWEYNPHDDIERIHAFQADDIAAPSRAIGDLLIKVWGLDPANVSHAPLPYIPSEELLNVPIGTHTNVVNFLGRLETRKGVLDFARAIPLILRRHPQTKFRFVGPAWQSPKPNLDMRQYLEIQLRRYRNSLDFTGHIPLDQIPSLLATTDVCVFPSIWESFGLVCIEAMSAGRGIVASSAGGMAELLNYGEVGRLVPPHSPEKIAAAVIELLDNPGLRMRLGQAARDRVLAEYNLERIGELQEASYVRAIQRRRALGVRLSTDAVKKVIA